MNKVLCYIYEGMADYEISLLLHYLKNIGNRKIVTVSENKQVITGQTGLRFVADVSIEALNTPKALEEYEALVIPGGPINNEQNAICDIVSKMEKRGKLVAAICFGPQFLARAGVLEEHDYTTSCTEEMIAQMGCKDPFNRKNCKNVRCVVDQNVITAQGHAFVDFAEAVCDYLEIFENPEQRKELFGRMLC